MNSGALGVMKRLLWLVAVLSLAGCSGMRHTEPSQADLPEANRQYDIALVTADAAALDRIYLDDFVYIGGTNAEKRNKQEQIRTMTSGAVKLLHGQSQDIQVKQLGDVAVLTGQFLGRVRIKDKEFSFRERYSTVWQFHKGMWRLALEHGSVVESKP